MKRGDMEWEELVALCHDRAHEAENLPEDALFISLTRREVWLTVLAHLILSGSAECLKDDCASFTERIAELIEVQKPQWRERGSPPS